MSAQSEKAKGKKRERDKKYRAIQYSKNIEFVNSIKRGGCSMCGYKKSLKSLQFHHAGNGIKEGKISGMVQRSSTRRLIKELQKCILVCANCHGEIHD